jgi:hypothetical protein
MTTRTAAISPRLLAAVTPDPAALLAAAAAELAVRAGDEMLGEDDVTAVMEQTRDALQTLSGLFRKNYEDENGPLHDAQYLGTPGEDDAAGKCNEAGWAMRDAARALTDALAARGR